MKKISVFLVLAVLLLVFAGCENAATGTGQVPQTQQQNPSQNTTGKTHQNTTLSKEDAQAAALAHAKLSAEAVTGLRAEYEVDDGVPQWEVDFRSGDWEYDYTIHAETGAVLEHNKEYDPEKRPSGDVTTQPKQTDPKETVPAVAEPLTAQQAEQIALDDAGLTADQVRGLRSEYDVDDGVPEYEVEFYYDGWEYNYTIHAETGDILKSDKDYDD